jgi:hypothetical protein
MRRVLHTYLCTWTYFRLSLFYVPPYAKVPRITNYASLFCKCCKKRKHTARLKINLHKFFFQLTPESKNSRFQLKRILHSIVFPREKKQNIHFPFLKVA